MAGSWEAQFKRDTTEGRTLHGWQVGADYDHEWEEASELDLTYYHLTKREEKGLRLDVAEGSYGLTSVTDVRSGELYDPEKPHFANGIADRIERDEAMMTQLQNHSEDQVMLGLFPKTVSNLEWASA